MPGTRVYVSVHTDTQAAVTFRNISRDPLDISADELMERFVRGDASRHTEGSGLGLSIAKSLTESMGGTFTLEVDGDLFKASVILPLSTAPVPEIPEHTETK
ncbi:MAG: ATP-binding protein, partial [Oscillospiraceae bacterium]|nr:ATP-binding protein [Oscillospiraceae bacterium]